MLTVLAMVYIYQACLRICLLRTKYALKDSDDQLTFIFTYNVTAFSENNTQASVLLLRDNICQIYRPNVLK